MGNIVMAGGVMKAGWSVSSVMMTALSRYFLKDSWPKKKAYTTKRRTLTIILCIMSCIFMFYVDTD